jgi:myosin V
MSHSYDVGTRAWQPDATEGWVASEVVKKSVDGDKVTLTFKLENEEVSTPPHPLSDLSRILISGPYPRPRRSSCRSKPSRTPMTPLYRR